MVAESFNAVAKNLRMNGLMVDRNVGCVFVSL